MAIPSVGNVLTDQHYREINKGLNHLAAGRRIIQMARDAGIPIQEYEDAYNVVEDRLNGIKRTFFPDRA